MTRLLEQALDRIRKLPDAQQDKLAELLIAEMESEQAWEAKFAATAPALENLAKQVLARDQAGRSASRGWDEL